MKAKILNTLAVMTLVLFCATGRAQLLPGSEIIYSNSFTTTSPLPYTSVYQTPPTYITSTNLEGASASAVWSCSFTNLNPAVNNPGASVPPYGAGTVYLNGDISTNQGCALLPLAVQTNAVYILQSSVTFPPSMPCDVRMGFTVNNGSTVSPDWDTNIGVCRFNDSPPDGYGWCSAKAGAASELFGGPKATTGIASFTTPGSQTYNLEIILSTLFNTNSYATTNFTGHGETNDWLMAFYVNGVQSGTNIYIANPANGPAPLQLGYAGLGTSGSAIGANPSGIQWNYFTVSTPWVPIINIEPSGTNALNENSVYTNTVLALADTNGGPLVYQWFTNGIPLSNGGNISGATNATLEINGVLPSNAGTNYYVVVTNLYGAVTSSSASLTVFGPPQFLSAFPITYTNLGSTNLMFLYGGSGAYYGSSPSFLVAAAGAQPIHYFWLTNGVPVGGAASSSLAFTNLSTTGPTTFACIASNYVSTVTNIWAATYLPSPPTPFQAAVMAAQPIAYWRMNDTNLDGVDNTGGDDGYVCHDYESGNDGIYTNVTLGEPSGYDPATDPTETAAGFATYDGLIEGCVAYSIGGNNLDFSASTNGEYTVALWANGEGINSPANEYGNAGLFCKGYFSGEEACLDIDPHTFNARLTMRNAAGSQFNAVSTENLADDNNWHYIVGVCDETNGWVYIYVDGVLEGITSIPSGSGVFNSSTVPISIGARSSDALPADIGNNQFSGAINDVAVYNYAMSPSQIDAQAEAAGETISPYLYLLAPLPPTNVEYLANTTVTIPATLFGTGPFGYYWTNLTAGGTIASGSSSVYGLLNASLTLPNISSGLAGDQLELIATNASASTNWTVTLTVPTPGVTLSYSNTIIYSNSFDGGPLTVGGTQPTVANYLVGGTNTLWACTYTNGINFISGSGSSTINGSGTLGTNQGEALLPFTPEPGYIYTLTGTLLENSSMGDYVHLGFSQFGTQTSNIATTRFNDNPPNGYTWLALENGLITFYIGSGANDSGGADSSVPISFPLTNTMQITLDTTANAWVFTSYIYTNSSPTAVEIGSAVTNPPIHFVGLGQQVNASPVSSPPTVQWQNVELTGQPVDVPPYLLPPSLPTSLVLPVGAALTIPANLFGMGPYGYYWTNETVGGTIVSGTTNNMAPLPATNYVATVPDSWSGYTNMLALVATNAYGGITDLVSVTVYNPSPTNIMATVVGTNLDLSWPVDHTGWQLQAQTNKVSKGISTNWANFNPSTGADQVVIPINLTNGTVFYRLIYTP
jgi:hypothetical protein